MNFTVPQQYLPDIKKFMAEGTLRVQATVPNDSGPAELGTLTFVDNAVDTDDGTIHLRATFANTQNRLWPGLYVNTLVTLSQQSQRYGGSRARDYAGSARPVCLRGEGDNTVEARPVVSNRTVQDEAVIDKGLQPGETIVTDGQV